MGKILNAYILPHPPIIVPGIGMGRERKAAKTIEAMQKAKLAGIDAGGLSEERKSIYNISNQLDHGALVPLYFIAKELEKFRLVCLSTPFLPLRKLYVFGKCIQEAVEELGENVTYIASGDLSHRLAPDSSIGFSPKGREYDESLVQKVQKGDVEGLLNTKESVLEEAGECGTRSIVMMFGALHNKEFNTEVYSYEGPFGVGYMIAKVNAAEI